MLILMRISNYPALSGKMDFPTIVMDNLAKFKMKELMEEIGAKSLRNSDLIKIIWSQSPGLNKLLP